MVSGVGAMVGFDENEKSLKNIKQNTIFSTSLLLKLYFSRILFFKKHFYDENSEFCHVETSNSCSCYGECSAKHYMMKMMRELYNLLHIL